MDRFSGCRCETVAFAKPVGQAVDSGSGFVRIEGRALIRDNEFPELSQALPPGKLYARVQSR
jgi:hypothetical protein